MLMFIILVNSWSVLPVAAGASPSPRYGFSGFVFAGQIFVSGGEEKKAGGDSRIYGDLWSLDLKTLRWTCNSERGILL
jgi:hypothetical protein